MPRRPGKLDPVEIDEALHALWTVESPQALDALLDTVPALSTPTLHAIVGQQYLRLRNDHDPRLEQAEPRYVDFFRALHWRLHGRLVEAAVGVEPEPPAADTVEAPYMPPFFAAVTTILAGRLPGEGGPPHLLDDGALQPLVEEIERLTGADAELPAREAAVGSRWCAVLVLCPACGERRLDVRAYRVDLVVAPELDEHLRAGRVNAAGCPRCGCAPAAPVRVWAMDPPGPGDPLAALSCAWRLAPHAYFYQPPAGTARDEENDRILENRFRMLWEVEPWPEAQEAVGAPGDGTVPDTMGVAYSVDELISLLERVREEAPPIPLPMQVMLDELTRKVESGILPMHQAAESILLQVPEVGRAWPLLSVGAAHLAPSPVRHLLHCLVAEAVAQAQQAAGELRAELARQSASSLLAMNENALAEAAVARLDDALAQLRLERDEDDAVRVRVELMAASQHADLLDAQGRPEEALAIREGLDPGDLLAGDSWVERVAREELASRRALALYETGRMREAFDLFSRNVEAWEELIEEGDEDDAEEVRRFLPTARHALSGSLANFAALITTVYESGDLEEPEEALDWAESLLRRALEISEQVGGWAFAGIQAHRLGALLSNRGDGAAAEAMVERAIRHAARAGDHIRMWTGHAFLADRALERGDGPGALEHIAAAAAECIHHEVGLGHRATRIDGTETLGQAAFEAVAAGADALRAIAVVESLRAANTAASISTGTPFRVPTEDLPEELAALVAERERLRLRLAWSGDDDDARGRLEGTEEELVEARRQLSLRDPRYARWVDATDQDVAAPESVVRRLRQLGPGALWLGVFASERGTWSYTAGPGGGFVERATLDGLPPLRDEEARWEEADLAAVAAAVLAPHAERLGRLGPEDTLVVSVAGRLARVPFAALPFAGGRLVERVRLVTTQGFGMLASALDRPAPPLDAFLLVGAPRRPDLDPLRGARDEVNAIAAVLRTGERSVDTLLGPAASVPGLARRSAGAAALHFACHAIADPSPERASKLMLSADTVHGDSGELSEDRILTDLDLLPGCLVDLAGCATGRIAESNAPLLGGLVPAFLVAGARCVIASLWPIADAPAAVLHTELYRSLATGGRPGAALAETQRRCIAGELGVPMADPRVWAAYVAYGAG